MCVCVGMCFSVLFMRVRVGVGVRVRVRCPLAKPRMCYQIGAHAPAFSFSKEAIGGVLKCTAMETPGPQYAGVPAVGKQTISTKKTAPVAKCVLI